MSNNYNNYYFFGDSLSYSQDPAHSTPALASLCHGSQDPLYAQSSAYPFASNGPLWSSAISGYQNYNQNFAWCGAQAPTLTTQIASYNALLGSNTNPANTVFSIWSGGDNYIHNIPTPTIWEILSYPFTGSVIKNNAESAAVTLTAAAKTEIQAAITELVKDQDVAANPVMLIANLPDLTLTPAVIDPFGVLTSVQGQEFLSGTSTATTGLSTVLWFQNHHLGWVVQPIVNAINLLVQSFASDVSTHHNQIIQELVNSNTGTILLDVNKFGAAIAANPKNFGFMDITDYCDESTTVLPLPNAPGVVPTTSSPPSTSCDGYLFYDPIHPTHYTHMLLASYACTTLGNANCGSYLTEFKTYFDNNKFDQITIFTNIQNINPVKIALTGACPSEAADIVMCA